MRPDRERPTILLMEDEPLISLDLCDTLVAAGYHVMGPANTATGALFLLKQRTPQAAIVDVLVKDGASTEVVQQLRRLKVPFLIHSGCAQDDPSAADCKDVPWLTKPAPPSDLLALLGSMCEREMVS